jgi:hypothetical protein
MQQESRPRNAHQNAYEAQALRKQLAALQHKQQSTAPAGLVMGVPRQPVMVADIENQLVATSYASSWPYSNDEGPRGGLDAIQDYTSQRSARSRSESRGRIPELDLDASASQRRSASQSGATRTKSSKGASSAKK